MKHVLCTGAAGFIGSHVTDLLIESGYTVTALDNLSQGNREWVHPKAEFVEGDITDLPLMKELCKGKYYVFHLAAMSRVLPSLAAGAEGCLYSAEQNIMGTLNVLIAASEANVKKFVYSASSTYYGNSPAPHYEIASPNPETPYAVSKYVGELYCEQFSRMYGLNTVCLRYFQVYGQRQPVSGEYAMVNGIFLDQKKRGIPLTIHGDGSQRRDFVHVRDVAKANLLAAEMKGGGHAVINIGMGKSWSIKQLADMVSPDQVHQTARAHDMKETRAGIKLCENLLKWKPEIDFETGMQELING